MERADRLAVLDQWDIRPGRLTSEVEPGYWEHYGYDVDGWVGHSNGRDDAPTSASS